jgi:hypothetical protein
MLATPLSPRTTVLFSTGAKLIDALKRSIPEGTQNSELKNEALRLGRELLRGSKYEEERWPNRRKWSAGRAAIAHTHDAQPRASHLRQPRAGFFRVQADRKGRRFPAGPLAACMSALRWRDGCSLRYCDDCLVRTVFEK